MNSSSAPSSRPHPSCSAFRVGRVKLLNPSGYIAQPSEEDEDWSHGAQTGHQWLKNLYTRA